MSVAHLDDDERRLVLGVVLEQFLAWVRTQAGTHHLRALLVFDEVYGFAPPHPANPPTKKPLLSVMKQARAYGVGVLVATQNPMDLDYRVLSNAGVWFVGRLQTDTDRARVVEAMSSVRGAGGFEPDEVADAIKRLAPRWFVARNAVPGAGRGALAVEDDAVVAARADDARGSAPRRARAPGQGGGARRRAGRCQRCRGTGPSRLHPSTRGGGAPPPLGTPARPAPQAGQAGVTSTMR